jgi:hypothetical protein
VEYQAIFKIYEKIKMNRNINLSILIAIVSIISCIIAFFTCIATYLILPQIQEIFQGTSHPTQIAFPKATEVPFQPEQISVPTTNLIDKSAQESQIRIESIKLMRDNGSGEPGDEVQSFTPADRKMHFEIKTTSMLPAGSKVLWVFIAVDIPDGKNIEITTVKTDVLAANVLSANLELPRDWPVGSYKADVYINDQLFKTIEYIVK